VNILEAPVRSVYRWKGRVESAKETLLMIKSSRKQFGRLVRAIEKIHTNDVPEIIALPIERGSPEYLSWIAESLQPSRARKTKSD